MNVASILNHSLIRCFQYFTSNVWILPLVLFFRILLRVNRPILFDSRRSLLLWWFPGTLALVSLRTFFLHSSNDILQSISSSHTNPTCVSSSFTTALRCHDLIRRAALLWPLWGPFKMYGHLTSSFRVLYNLLLTNWINIFFILEQIDLI